MASGTSLMQISSLLLCASSHCDSIFYIWAQLLQVCKFIKTLKYQSSNCMVLFSKILNKFYYSENNVNFTPTIKNGWTCAHFELHQNLKVCLWHGQ